MTTFLLGLTIGILGTAGFFLECWRPMTPDERAERLRKMDEERRQWPGER